MADYNYRRRLLLLLLLLRRRRRYQRVIRSTWVRDIFQSRVNRREYHALINEMRLVDHESFYKYFHMTPHRFDTLLSLVGPALTRQTTQMRTPISPGERLAVTLRYLVTGDHDSMQTMSLSAIVWVTRQCATLLMMCVVLYGILFHQSTCALLEIVKNGKELATASTVCGTFPIVWGQ